MSNQSPYLDEYDLKRVIFLGAAASTTLIFLFLFLQFISYHEVFNLPVIDEMMAYAELFLFAYSSYFVAAILVRQLSGGLAKYLPSWLPICFLGSMLFCLSFFSRVYISDVMTYQEGDPFRSPPNPSGMILSVVVIIGVLTFVVSIFTVFAWKVYAVFDSGKD